MKEAIIGLIMGVSVAAAPFLAVDTRSNTIFSILISAIVLFTGWYQSVEKAVYRWSNLIIAILILISISFIKYWNVFILFSLMAGIALFLISLRCILEK